MNKSFRMRDTFVSLIPSFDCYPTCRIVSFTAAKTNLMFSVSGEKIQVRPDVENHRGKEEDGCIILDIRLLDLNSKEIKHSGNVF